VTSIGSCAFYGVDVSQISNVETFDERIFRRTRGSLK